MWQRCILRAIDIGFGDLHLGRISAQRNPVAEGLERMRIEAIVGALRQREIAVIDECLAPDRERQHHRAVAALGMDRIEHADIVRRHHVVEAFAIVRHERIPVDQPADPLGHPVGDPGDDHAAIAVPGQDDVTEVVLDEIIDDRLDGLRKTGRLGVARPVALDGGGQHLVAGRSDRRRRRLEFRAGVPGAMNKHKF